MNIGHKIKELRKERGITQEQLANNIGISFQAISKWETGIALPDITLTPILASYFGISMDELFDFSLQKIEIEIEKINPQHIGVVNAWAGKILHGTPLIAEGAEGLKGVILSNAMHLSDFLGKEIEIPFDEDLYYEELMKRVATSKKKENVTATFADTNGTYGGAKL